MTGNLNSFSRQRKGGQMDWVKEFKALIGITDEGYFADLNDVDNREILTEQHLERLKETTANVDVAVSDSTV